MKYYLTPSRVSRTCLLALLLASASLTHAAAPKGKERIIDTKSKGVRKLEVSSSFVGYRNTLIFYTLADQKAVLKVVIDNKSKKFPVAASVYLFANDVTEDGLKKWLNNQHSDGLFPDVPNPVATHKLPAESCKALSHKLIDQTKQRFGEYDNYAVSFQISDAAKMGAYRIKQFTDKATVHVKTN